MRTIYTKNNEMRRHSVGSATSAILDNSLQSESLQRKADMVGSAAQHAPRPNLTGLPDALKSGIENLSGFSMDDVRVHYNSSKPATVQALAYTQGTDIHVAPGQEKHLPHEAWHVVQQKAGHVSPTTNINGMPVNDNAALEHEADVMGEKAIGQKKEDSGFAEGSISKGVCQRKTAIEYQPMIIKYTDGRSTMEEDMTDEAPTKEEKLMTDGDPTKEEKKYASLKSLERDDQQKMNGYSSVKVGHLTTAKLDPQDPIHGSEPGAHQKDLMNAIKPDNYKTNPFIKGHLLNHHLGGLGIADNMIPITEHANALHEMYVEQGVKNLVYANRIKAIYKNEHLEKANQQLIEAIKQTNTASDNLSVAKKNKEAETIIKPLEAKLNDLRQNEVHARERASAKNISSTITGDKAIDYMVKADMLNSNQTISKNNPPEVLLSCSVTYNEKSWNASIHSGPRPEEASSSGNITNMINSFIEGDSSNVEKSDSDISELNFNYLHISAPELENVGLGGALTEKGCYATGLGKKNEAWITKTQNNTTSKTPIEAYSPDNNDVKLFKAMRAIDAIIDPIKENLKAKIVEAELNGTLDETIQTIQSNTQKHREQIINLLTRNPQSFKRREPENFYRTGKKSKIDYSTDDDLSDIYYFIHTPH